MKCHTATSVLLLATLMSGLAIAQESSGKKEKKGTDSLDIEFSKTITMEMRLGGCEAKLQMEYWQKGDVAEVKSTLDNPECGASSGDYQMRVRYRGADGKLQTDEYDETWERDDAQPIVTTKRYPIGDDVDLVRVTSRGLSCTCKETATDDQQ